MANNGKKITSSQISNNILDALEILTNSSIQSAQFDKTVVGIIVSCEDENIGKYKVQYQDAIFIAYSSSLDVKYTKGTSVQVKIPNNDFNGRKMIIGTVSENGIDFGDVIEDPLLRYEIIGTNCITSGEGKNLCSYWGARTYTLFNKDSGINEIQLNEQMFKDNLKLGSSVLLGANIRTAIPQEQRFKGDYGISYTFTFNDPAVANKTIDRNYVVNIDKMTGDPYSYEQGSEQIIPFEIDIKNFLYVKKIEVFAYDFIKYNLNMPEDIFISNIRLQPARRLDLEEYDTTGLTVIQPQGAYFSGTEGIPTKTAVAQLRIQGKLTTSSAVEYYWFEEDLTVTTTDNLFYSRYAGRGWRCLNRYNVLNGTDANPTEIQFINEGDTFSFKQNDSKARVRYYKCVAIYRDVILSADFSFTNNDIAVGVSISNDRGVDFTDNIGATTLTCTAPNAVTYKWVSIDPDKTFTPINQTTADNNRYESALSNYNTLYNQIATGTKPDNATNRNQLALYKEILDEFETKMRVDENQIINLQAGSIFGHITYKCEAFDSNGDSLGIASQLLTNTLKSQNDRQIGQLTIHNGNQVFKYNAKGVSPTSEQFENPQVIQPLGFTLRTADGQEVPQSAIKESDISWIVPIKDSMIRSYTGTFVSTDEEQGFSVYNGKNLSYTINENYYARRDNNEIELQVSYLGILYTAKTNLFFLKDGDTGTNGTDLVVRLIPKTTYDGYTQIVTGGESGTDWFKVELWRGGNLIYDGYGSGSSTEGKTVTITWSLVGLSTTNHNISVTSNGANAPSWYATPDYSSNYMDIAKATVVYDNNKVVATAPVCREIIYDSQYRIALKKNTGFIHVVYSADGKNPDYDNKAPFEIIVQKDIEENGVYTDVTDIENFSYAWRRDTHGGLFFKGRNRDVIGFTARTAELIPVEQYNDNMVTNWIRCTVSKNGTDLAMIYIPIHFMLNAYGHSAINDWDGNAIELDADGGTMLLAPQAGFGEKDTQTNTFNGVLLGKVKTDNVTERGFMGYYQGIRTIFLNSDDGSAVFGRAGGGQIIFDPSSGTNGSAIIKSGNYVWDSDNGTGMQINLSEPGIYFGSQKFYVNSDGILHAEDGIFHGTIKVENTGQIGPWYITSTSIHNKTRGNNFNVADTSGAYFGESGLSVGRTRISSDGTLTVYRTTGQVASNINERTVLNTDGFYMYNSSGKTVCSITDTSLQFYDGKGHMTFQAWNDGEIYANKYNETLDASVETFRLKNNGTITFKNYNTNKRTMQLSPSGGLVLYDSSSSSELMTMSVNQDGLTLYDSGSTTMSVSQNGLWLYNNGSTTMSVSQDGLYLYKSGTRTLRLDDEYLVMSNPITGNQRLYLNNEGFYVMTGESDNTTMISLSSSGLTIRDPSTGSRVIVGNSGGFYAYNPQTNSTRISVTQSGLYCYNDSGGNRLIVDDDGIYCYDNSGNLDVHLGVTGPFGDTGLYGMGLQIKKSSRYYMTFGKWNGSQYTTPFIINHGLNPYKNRADIVCAGSVGMESYCYWGHDDISDQKNVIFTSAGLWAEQLCFWVSPRAYVDGNMKVNGTFSASGGKNRYMQTRDFGEVYLAAYETPTPYFGDIGQGQCDETGYAYIYLDDIFQEVIQMNTQYYVFLQGLRGSVELWDQYSTYFVVKGAPGQKFNFEIKALQAGVNTNRFNITPIEDAAPTINRGPYVIPGVEPGEEILDNDYKD